MTPREKKLAAAVLLLVVLWGGNALFQRYSTWQQAAASANLNARTSYQEIKLTEAKTNSAIKQLRQWQEKSLPANPNIAQSQYRAWLIKLLQESHLKIEDVTPSASSRRSNAYRNLTYNIDAEGDLAAVIQFLDRFYRSDQLHKIGMLRLTPLDRGSQLRVNLTVEALVVHGTKREAGLNDEVSNRLALSGVDEYMTRVVGRDFFREYTPPKPPPRPRPPVVQRPKVKPTPTPKFDDSEHAYLTGLTQTEQGQLAWVTVRTTGESYQFLTGDEVSIGLLEGEVVQVTPRYFVLQTEEGLLRVMLGDSLRDGESNASSSGG